MMDYTDRHCRYLLRLVSPGALLYTEMVTAQASRTATSSACSASTRRSIRSRCSSAGPIPQLLAQRGEARRGSAATTRST